MYTIYKPNVKGRAHFWPQGHNLNKHCRGSLDDATLYIPNIKSLGLVVSDKIFF